MILHIAGISSPKQKSTEKKVCEDFQKKQIMAFLRRETTTSSPSVKKKRIHDGRREEKKQQSESLVPSASLGGNFTLPPKKEKIGALGHTKKRTLLSFTISFSRLVVDSY